MARRRKRTGRPAHNRKDGPRTASGKLSRSKAAKKVKHGHKQAWLAEAETQTISVVVEQRVKRGIKRANARDAAVETVQGQMFHDGQITKDEYITAEWFCHLLNDYRGAVGSPAHVYSRPEDHTPSFAEDAHERWVERVMARWQEVNRAIVDCVYQNRNAEITAVITRVLEKQMLPGDLKDRVKANGDVVRWVRYWPEDVRMLKSALRALEEVRNPRRRRAA